MKSICISVNASFGNVRFLSVRSIVFCTNSFLNSRSRSSQLFFNPLRFILPLLTQKCPKQIKYIYYNIKKKKNFFYDHNKTWWCQIVFRIIRSVKILWLCCANKFSLIKKKKKTIDTYNYEPKNKIIKLCNKTKNCAPWHGWKRC